MVATATANPAPPAQHRRVCGSIRAAVRLRGHHRAALPEVRIVVAIAAHWRCCISIVRRCASAWRTTYGLVEDQRTRSTWGEGYGVSPLAQQQIGRESSAPGRVCQWLSSLEMTLW